jgi:3-phosphoshikimate 1-carboxyvinyltransferase
LADKCTLISCAETEAEDIHATINCLTALGATIGRNEDGFSVTPIDKSLLAKSSKAENAGSEPIIFPCGESGSTLRFMLPVVCALGIRGAFEMKGRLPERPLAPLDAQLQKHGIRLWRDQPGILNCEGQLQASDDYTLPGDISSQYVTGLLMALPLLSAPSKLTVAAPIESADYVVMTLDTAEAFSARPVTKKNFYKDSRNTRFDTRTDTEYEIEGIGTFTSPAQVSTDGDWSNAAFWLCAGAMPRGNVWFSGLQKESTQGDREIYTLLNKMGANITWDGDKIHAQEADRHSSDIDARAIPDLIPILAAVAAVGQGTTTFRNASRLRIKESDRLMSTAKTLKALGANIRETADGLVVQGVKKLGGGIVDAHGDHRIAMMAAIASTACTEPVTITGAQAVKKSYPNFWNDLKSLGKKVIEE